MSVWQKLTRRSPKEGALFGIELEIENVCEEDTEDASFRQFASVTTDGSLRDGIEIVTLPLRLSDVEQFASLYEDWATESDVTLSERCSTHIHTNVSDMDYEQLRSFLWLSTVVEPVLLEYCTDVRRSNTYCYKTSDVTNTSSWLRGLLYHSQQDSLSRYLGDNQPPKYCAVGLFRFQDYGTVEFRMFDGTTSAANIMAWCRMIDSLRQSAINLTVEQLRDKKQREGLLSLLTETIKQSGTIPDDRLISLLDKGVEMANDIVRKAMTFQEIVEKHKELFPNRVPLAIVRGTFGVELLTAYNTGGIAAVQRHVSQFNRSAFITEYGSSDGLFNLFREINKDIVVAAEIVTVVRQQYSL